MKDINNSDLESVCKQLQNATHEMLTWKWDDRLESALSEFNINIKESIRSIFDSHLSLVWDGSSMGDTAHKEKAAGHPLGDARPGQMLFISDYTGSSYIFCAWWPWGDGETISIRITPINSALTEQANAEQIEQFRGWFGI